MRANFYETMTAGGTTYRRCQNIERKTTKNLKKGLTKEKRCATLYLKGGLCMKLSIRLTEPMECDYHTIKNYLEEISDRFCVDMNITPSNVIRQALNIAAIMIDNPDLRLYDLQKI